MNAEKKLNNIQIISSLKNEYVAVRRDNGLSFGGDQGWFSKLKRLSEYGCGTVGMGDIELYLLGRTSITSKQYEDYILGLFNKKYKFKTAIGLMPFRMTSGLRKIFKRMGQRKKVRWHFKISRHFKKANIKRMLENDLPVLVAYNRLSRKKEAALYMYNINEQGDFVSSQRCFSHYFVVTGLVNVKSENESAECFVVSSCGEKLYVKCEDFFKGDFFSGMLLCL